MSGERAAGTGSVCGRGTASAVEESAMEATTNEVEVGIFIVEVDVV